MPIRHRDRRGEIGGNPRIYERIVNFIRDRTPVALREVTEHTTKEVGVRRAPRPFRRDPDSVTRRERRWTMRNLAWKSTPKN